MHYLCNLVFCTLILMNNHILQSHLQLKQIIAQVPNLIQAQGLAQFYTTIRRTSDNKRDKHTCGSMQRNPYKKFQVVKDPSLIFLLIVRVTQCSHDTTSNPCRQISPKWIWVLYINSSHDVTTFLIGISFHSPAERLKVMLGNR